MTPRRIVLAVVCACAGFLAGYQCALTSAIHANPCAQHAGVSAFSGIGGNTRRIACNDGTFVTISGEELGNR